MSWKIIRVRGKQETLLTFPGRETSDLFLDSSFMAFPKQELNAVLSNHQEGDRYLLAKNRKDITEYFPLAERHGNVLPCLNPLWYLREYKPCWRPYLSLGAHVSITNKQGFHGGPFVEGGLRFFSSGTYRFDFGLRASGSLFFQTERQSFTELGLVNGIPIGFLEKRSQAAQAQVELLVRPTFLLSNQWGLGFPSGIGFSMGNQASSRLAKNNSPFPPIVEERQGIEYQFLLRSGAMLAGPVLNRKNFGLEATAEVSMAVYFGLNIGFSGFGGLGALARY